MNSWLLPLSIFALAVAIGHAVTAIVRYFRCRETKPNETKPSQADSVSELRSVIREERAKQALVMFSQFPQYPIDVKRVTIGLHYGDDSIWFDANIHNLQKETNEKKDSNT